MLITSPSFEQTHHWLSRLHWELSKQKLPRANCRKCGASRINSFLFMFSRCEAALNSRPARFREKTKLNLPTAERCLDAWKNVHTRLPYSNRRQSKRWICARALLNASLLHWKEPWKGAMSEHWRTRVRSASRYQQFPPTCCRFALKTSPTSSRSDLRSKNVQHFCWFSAASRKAPHNNVWPGAVSQMTIYLPSSSGHPINNFHKQPSEANMKVPCKHFRN